MRTGHLYWSLITFCFSTLPCFAALAEWRTQVQVSTGSGVGTQFAFDGGLNAPFSSQALAAGPQTQAEASSELSEEGFIPTLRAKATTSSISAQAIAWGVQGYTNTSGSPLDTTLMLDLSAEITGSNDLEARVYLFEDENFEFSFDPGTILFESTSRLWPGFPANDLSPTGFDIDINSFTGAVDEQRSFDFTVAPGDSFYVWARLVTTVDNPGEVDAFSTLTASLSNTAGLTPAAVPEPSQLSLLLAATACLLVRRRPPGIGSPA